MVYQNNFVATIKVGGKILRENKDVVAVPFGAEYSIYLKNLSSVRAVANVWIDGVDVTEGNWVIVDPNTGWDLERYIRNGNFNKGNKFKFIERTGQIEEARGIGSEDGLIRVEYKFEVPQPAVTYWPSWTYYNSNLQGGQYTLGNLQQSQNVQYSVTNTTPTSSHRPADTILRSCNFTKSTESRSVGAVDAMNCCFMSDTLADSFATETSAAPNEAGITVSGGVSHQKFVQGAYFPTESVSHVIVLKLVGKVKGQKVEKPITVQAKPACSTCKKLNKATAKFCSACGTSLQLF